MDSSVYKKCLCCCEYNQTMWVPVMSMCGTGNVYVWYW